MNEQLTVDEHGFRSRVYHEDGVETLIYLPGLHGDWTLLGPFRQSLPSHIRLVEFAYPQRTDWELSDLVDAILSDLSRRGISHGWLLGESFSSQVAWAIAEFLHREQANPKERSGFDLRGIFLAGGFVQHPVPWGVRWARRISDRIPMSFLRVACEAFGRLGRYRCRRHGVDSKEIDLFVARRSCEVDRKAITSRYSLIESAQFRPFVRSFRKPVYCLTGAVDPIVPWPLIFPWIRRWCPGYQGERVIWGAGHNVLLDAPDESSRQIVAWMSARSGQNPSVSTLSTLASEVSAG